MRTVKIFLRHILVLLALLTAYFIGLSKIDPLTAALSGGFLVFVSNIALSLYIQKIKSDKVKDKKDVA